jgi:septal ring-binding cell division protein DamX
VLEGRHVIGLFLGVMLLSGLFFTLGYVMGLHQAEASADDLPGKPEVRNPSKVEPAAKRANKTPPAESPADTGAPASSDWEFYHAGEKGKTDDRLKPAPSASAPQLQQSAPVFVKSPTPPPAAANNNRSNASSSPTMLGNNYSLQVAALHREGDALELAKLLQKKKFPAYVLSPHGDKYYRVQVGPYADLKAADAARKGLEGAGFKAFVKH